MAVLWVRVSEKKSSHARELKMLGIMVNAKDGAAWIGQDKLDGAMSDIDDMLNSKQVANVDIQATTGRLLFITRVFPTGKAFLRRLYDMSVGAETSSPQATRYLPRTAIAELKWWLTNLVL